MIADTKLAPLAFKAKSSGLIPRSLTLAAVLLIILILAIILGNIFLGGFRTIDWTFLTHAPENGMQSGGIFPAIFGTVAMVILMVIAVVPVGVLTAVYLHEYTRPDSFVTRLIRIAINNLAGVPSIVFGLFGLGFFVGFIGHGIDTLFYNSPRPVWGQPAIIWASLTLALLTLPVVIVSTEEALRVIPRELREASYALGATKLQTIIRIVIPQALPGILTGAILGVSRGAGEVAPIMFTGAAYYLPQLPTNLHDQFMVLGYHVYVMATQSPNMQATRPILYGTVLVLLLLTILLNVVAILIRSRIRSRRVYA
ncbi:phosphate ABC transporter permease PtsA [candidate division GN15 bacterium]|uniref:Phosphate transport system permease protein PstA n=1 Tax=candidate division GN15 bacterium TaxID=2072418 RepID=A0A855X4C1_9BACT|nr:MAG: phosphate ABC transporter permease PtsA [candidate division GN15 bacterium]